MIRERVNAGGARARADKHCGRPFIETKLEMLWLLLVALACTRSPSSSALARALSSASPTPTRSREATITGELFLPQLTCCLMLAAAAGPLGGWRGNLTPQSTGLNLLVPYVI